MQDSAIPCEDMHILGPERNASRRTKNRFSEHSLKIHPARRNTHMDGQSHVMLRCIDSGCSWFGWIPKKEIRSLDQRGEL